MLAEYFVQQLPCIHLGEDVEKGQLWLEAAIEEKANHVEQIHEQHERREKRHNEAYGLWWKSK